MVRLQRFVLQTSWSGAQKERNSILDEAVSLLLKPPKRVAESESEKSLQSGRTRKCSFMISLYSCDISEAMNRYATRHGAGSQRACIRCLCTYQNIVVCRKSSRRVVVETTETQRKLEVLQDRKRSLAGMSRCRRRREGLNEIGFLLS